MEGVLDAFVRDTSKRPELASISKDSSQIRGALRILGLDDADRLMALCEEQIQAYAEPTAPVADEDLELLAESLAGLGFFIEAIERQRADCDRFVAPFLAKRLDETPLHSIDEATAIG